MVFQTRVVLKWTLMAMASLFAVWLSLGVSLRTQAQVLIFSTETPTVTITAPVPFQPDILSTPTLPTDFTCPSGQPLLWGTVTPNALWQMMCGQCQYTPFPTAHPVPTWNGTGTPPPPTATETATATPPYSACAAQTQTAVPSSGPGTPSSTPYVTPTFAPTIAPDPVFYLDNTCGLGTMSAGVPYQSGWSYAFTISIHVPGYCHFQWQVTYPATYYLHWDITSNTGTNGVNPSSYSGGSQIVVLPIGASTADFVDVVSSGSDYPEINFGFSNDTDLSGTLYILPQPFIPAPCIDATPSPYGSYCSVVDGVEPPFFGYLGYGATGRASCLDIGGSGDLWNYNIFGVTLSVPWLAHICLTEWLFGTAVIFGVSFSMDAVLYVVAVAWLVRNAVL